MSQRGRGNSQGDSTCKPGPYIARIVRWVKGGEIFIKHVSLVHTLNILFEGGWSFNNDSTGKPVHLNQISNGRCMSALSLIYPYHPSLSPHPLGKQQCKQKSDRCDMVFAAAGRPSLFVVSETDCWTRESLVSEPCNHSFWDVNLYVLKRSFWILKP